MSKYNAKKMPDGVFVYDNPFRGYKRTTGADMIIEGYYYNHYGEKCLLMQFEDPEVEKEYAAYNGIKAWAVAY